MLNKSFEACKAKPLNIRSSIHADFVPRVNMVAGKVYRLCNIKAIKSSIPSLKEQLGEGTYYFIPVVPEYYRGVVVRKKLDGQLCLIVPDLFYVSHSEGLYKLRSPSDKALESLILSIAKTSSAALDYANILDWD